MTAQQILLLISRTVSGDNEAFEQLIHSQTRKIYYLIRRMIDCAEDVEDIRQEVAILVFQHIGTLKHPEAFGSWLNTLVTRVCSRHIAARNPVDPLEALQDYGALFVETDADCLPAAYSDLLELRVEIRSALSRMPENLRRVVVMYYLDGMRYREIADLLDMTIGTVSTYMFRARERLRTELKQHYFL